MNWLFLRLFFTNTALKEASKKAFVQKLSILLCKKMTKRGERVQNCWFWDDIVYGRPQLYYHFHTNNSKISKLSIFLQWKYIFSFHYQIRQVRTKMILVQDLRIFFWLQSNQIFWTRKWTMQYSCKTHFISAYFYAWLIKYLGYLGRPKSSSMFVYWLILQGKTGKTKI